MSTLKEGPTSCQSEVDKGSENIHHHGSARKHVFHLLLLSFGFLAVFTAFSATQNLESSLIPGKLGYFSVATIYAGLCLGALFIAAPFIQVVNPKWSLVIASITYASLMAANLKPTWEIILPCAALLGLGASILWPAQGSYITAAAANYAKAKNQDAKAALGLFNGIFWMIFQFSQVIGNITAALVLSHAGGPRSNAVQILFFLFLGIALLGTVLFAFLPSELNPQTKENVSIRKKIIAPFYLFKGDTNSPFTKLADIRMILLWPLFFYAGMEGGFFAGNFTKSFITDNVGKDWIGYIFAAYGAIDAISSFVVGKLADSVGKKAMIAIGFLSHFGFLLFCLIFLKVGAGFDFFKHESNIWSLFIMAGIWGIGDSVINTLGGVILGYYFTEQTEAAFSHSKLIQSISYVITFICGAYVDIYWNVLTTSVLLVLSVVCLFILDRAVSPLDAQEPTIPQ